VGGFEISLSQVILHKEKDPWNITSIQEDFRMVDFRENVELDPGDAYYRFEYLGSRIKPKDFIFFKTTRGQLSPEEISEIGWRD
jgi:hypothetical protein